MLPPNYSIRPLHRADYHNGVLSVLRVLTTVGEISEEAWNDRYDWMAKHPDEYFILVILNAEQNIVGTGSVIVERKLYVPVPMANAHNTQNPVPLSQTNSHSQKLTNPPPPASTTAAK